ncbi:neurofilament medium polypeptide-like isoform X2 [Battus philenor]|uniref:neurofilament medium polypeptide-like isoform X2 n=1 Tax=Battus philenor TaxID=42288 RepID=UPI0035D0C88C
MKLYALILVLVACHARALPIEQEIPDDVKPVEKEPIDDVSVENLQITPDAIPVAIVEESIPALKKVDENSNDYIPSDDEPSIQIKRLEIDLDNPGPPQRQEHETQNPGSYSDRDFFVDDIKQKLLETENVFKKSVLNVNEGFQNWVPNSQHLKTIQNDLKEMQSKFLGQLADLNQSLKSYLNPQSTKSVLVDPESTANLRQVENRLKDLEYNFKAGVETLTAGVKALEAKADGEEPQKPAETGSAGSATDGSTTEQTPNNPLGQIFSFFSDSIGQAITQVQNTFTSFTNPNNSGSDAPPSGSQSDEATSRPPSIWENFTNQMNQIFNGGQKPQSGQSTSNPLNQANQFITNILNQFRPQANNPASKPDKERVTPKPSQSEPAQSDDAAPTKPDEQPVKKETPVTPQPGPIRQIVQNNPIVKGIVQRIQSITNPEKPREKEPQKNSEPVKSENSIKEETVPATKGHGHGGYYEGNGGNGGPATAA